MWFSDKPGWTALMVRLSNPRGVFQPKQFYHSMTLSAPSGTMASMGLLVSLHQVLSALCHLLSLFILSCFSCLSKNTEYQAWLLCLYGNKSSNKKHWRQCSITNHQSRLSSGEWQGSLLKCRYHKRGQALSTLFFLMWINVCFCWNTVSILSSNYSLCLREKKKKH